MESNPDRSASAQPDVGLSNHWAKLNSRMNLRRFPLDSQRCFIQIGSFGHNDSGIATHGSSVRWYLRIRCVKVDLFRAIVYNDSCRQILYIRLISINCVKVKIPIILPFEYGSRHQLSGPEPLHYQTGTGSLPISDKKQDFYWYNNQFWILSKSSHDTEYMILRNLLLKWQMDPDHNQIKQPNPRRILTSSLKEHYDAEPKKIT